MDPKEKKETKDLINVEVMSEDEVSEFKKQQETKNRNNKK